MPHSEVGPGSGSEPDPLGERWGETRKGGILGRLALPPLGTSGGKSESEDRSGTGKEEALASPEARGDLGLVGPPVNPNK